MFSRAKTMFAFGLLLLILSGATLFFGADAPLASYVFSTLIFVTAGGWFLFAPNQAQLPATAIVPAFLLAGFFAMDVYWQRIALALPEYASLAAAGVVFLMARAWARASERVIWAWEALIWIMAAIAIWALIDFVVAPENLFGQVRPFHTDRLSMSFLSANTAATWLGMGFLIALSQIIKVCVRLGFQRPVILMEELGRHHLPALILFLSSFLALVLTASRAGLSFTLLAAALLLLWEIDAARRQAGERAGKGLGTSLLVIGSIAALALTLWAFYAEIVGARTTGLEEDANVRAVMYRAYGASIADSPIIGHGLGSFEAVNNRIMAADNASVLAIQGAAHNIELQWLMQGGVLGSLAMWGVLAFIFGSIWQGLRVRRRLRGQLRAVLAVSLLVILHGQVDYALEIPGFMWWWALLLGLAAGIADGRVSAPVRPQRQINV